MRFGAGVLIPLNGVPWPAWKHAWTWLGIVADDIEWEWPA